MGLIQAVLRFLAVRSTVFAFMAAATASAHAVVDQPRARGEAAKTQLTEADREVDQGKCSEQKRKSQLRRTPSLHIRTGASVPVALIVVRRFDTAD